MHLAPGCRRRNDNDMSLREGPMGPAEYRRICQSLGLSLSEAARRFGFSARQTTRYAAGARIPAPTRKLLRLAAALAAMGIPPERIAEL